MGAMWHTTALARTAVIGIAVVLVLFALVWGLQRRLIYFPDTDQVPAAAVAVPGARDVTLRTSDGLRLGAWFVPGRSPTARSMTVLVAAGNAGNRAGRAPFAAALADRGLSVLLFDYRGYGGNPGSPSEAGLARDVRAAYRYLTEDARTPPSRLMYFGESLGAAVVSELAITHPPAALLLRSPFTALAAVGRHHYPFLPVGLLLRDRFPVTSYVARVSVPTTVVLGTADTVVPPDQSRAVADAAAGPTTVVEIPGADHNDVSLFTGPQLITAITDLATRTAPS